jgi:release factor glutamine methyltransferase
MTVEDGYKHLLFQLHKVYDEREASNITDLIIEHITRWKKAERILYKKKVLTIQQQETLDEYTHQLMQHRPVQYVLGEAWFAGMKFLVDESVLIPRPETEELAEWIIEDILNTKSTTPSTSLSSPTTILDVGTGSGCIPIALKKRLKDISVTSLDISEGALAIAQKNAFFNETDIHFLLYDFLNEEKWKDLPVFDIIVSNPPYIKQSERAVMSKNVLDFEPHLALFVPDDNALLFYRKLATFGNHQLSPACKIYVEINESLGEEVFSLFTKEGYRVELRKDLQGKERMLKATILSHL